MLFGENFGLDSDDVLYAYYAGLLGKATKDLPVKLVDNKHDTQYTQNFSWTLNSAGYPISFKGNHNLLFLLVSRKSPKKYPHKKQLSYI